ncbi:MAG: UDP-N-acetylmuramoyl-L-alanyl-D-glutamate--2,6-diaminopimelate ligase [Thiohalocapsa sp.]|uniref:Mur ligase family protein n=1 Tax=Thiohalocapsa sp. TaxID=2497641 RepID=UPI0025FE174F|nr:UDP-N-acetylmuramoyl-L-alanyl-D-glutamate--2,6-diaminopimelate ligase [Thiohalocapsa sp.]MCG6942536.1 UDP-N-acetylmuramoyl-L-alanyl-D-glutamate--2,6-diaminopimelate ligase [Thiohalocapsa sp.]
MSSTAPPQPPTTPPDALPPPATLFGQIRFAWQHLPAGLALDSLTDIQWRADACSPGSILCFQRFDDGRGDAELFERYLAPSPFAVLVTNRPMDCFDALRAEGKAIFVTGPDAYGDTVARLCDAFHPLPQGHWRVAAVTGTNGKTTTVKYLEALLAAAGERVLSIGTLGLALNGEDQGITGFTSPPLVELRRVLAAYRDRADVLVTEASSHALEQGRLAGLQFDAAGWTNFSVDHLDYHGTEDAYFAAKTRILRQLTDGVPLLVNSAEVAARLRREQPTTRIQPLDPAPLPAPVLAERPFLALAYNQANYALALALAERISDRLPAEPWRALSAVDGRFETRVHGNRTVVVDFAHTPDALENVLGAIRAAFPDARVTTLFGCGGDRDRTKRPLMGAAVCRHSDHAIVTSDNPRFEEPLAIIEQTVAGMGGCTAEPEVIVERAEAIRHLFDRLAAAPADEPQVALIAGKGHERYIDRNGQKTDYSDQDQVAYNFARLGWLDARSDA